MISHYLRIAIDFDVLQNRMISWMKNSWNNEQAGFETWEVVGDETC